MKKQKKTIVALMYDFDNTLSTKDMQEYSFIPSLGESVKSFWGEANRLTVQEGMDPILTYMYLMIRMSKDRHKPISRDVFENAGREIKLYPGVEDWFERMNRFGEECGVEIQHYIISSGLKEIIEGSKIADRFREIFACEFHYDENGAADWPKVAVNYTTKTQFLFRINKGLFSMAEDKKVNEYIPDEDRPVPFTNMIYLGDGMTDVPCMKLVNVYGGQSIAVYSGKNKDTCKKLIDEHRVNFIAKANYEEGRELDLLVKDIITKVAAVSKLTSRKKY